MPLARPVNLGAWVENWSAGAPDVSAAITAAIAEQDPNSAASGATWKSSSSETWVSFDPGRCCSGSDIDQTTPEADGLFS